ncbi:GDSL esterase/lipase-like protein [Drosera capensis]
MCLIISVSMSIWITLFIIVCTLDLCMVADAEPRVPCYFIFGDSLSDNGNNAQLPTKAKANYSPYGVDFPGGHSNGRFTNGRTMVDFIAEKLGFQDPITAYNAVQFPMMKLPQGLNYASGGAGIHPESGDQLISGIAVATSFDQQVQNHASVILRLAQDLKLGSCEVVEHLSKCLYNVNIGSNDYINNYYAPDNYFVTREQYTPEEYASILIALYSRQIQKLYESGARKFALFGLSAIGCAPMEIILRGTSNDSICNNDINNAIQIFNKNLQTLVDKMNNVSGTNAKLVYIDMYDGLITILPGFTVFDRSCCMVTRSFGQCDRGLQPCKDRDTHVFYDNIHLTEAAYKALAEVAYTQILPLLS